MDKIIFQTINCIDKDKPSFSDKRKFGEKLPYMMLAKIFWSQTKDEKESGEKLVSFWEKIHNDGFERSNLSTKKIAPVIDDLKDEKIIPDFIYLKNLEKAIKNSDSNKMVEMLKAEKHGLEIISYLKPSGNEFINIIDKIKRNIEKTQLTDNEKSRLKELLHIDFNLIYNFLEKNNFLYDLTDNLKIKSDDFLISLDYESAEKNKSLKQIIENEFITLDITFNDSKISLDNNKIKELFQQIESFNPEQNKNLFIKGIEGSGKSILSIALSIESVKRGFYPVFIPVDNNYLKMVKTYNDQVKTKGDYFIVFDGINNLYTDRNNITEIREFFSNIIRKKDNNLSDKTIIVCNMQNDDSLYTSLFKKTFLDKYFQNLNINELKDTPKNWINSPMEKVIFDQVKEKAETRSDFYKSYLNSLIDLIAEKVKGKYEKKEIKELFQKIAYSSILDDRFTIDDLNLNDDLLKMLSRNKILKVNDFDNKITFTHKSFRDYLASEYILYTVSSRELEIELSNQVMESNNWNSLMLFIADRLNNTNKIALHNKPKLIEGILYHLRQNRKLDKIEEIIGFIDDKNLQEQEKKKFYLEKAKSFYNKGDYLNSCIYSFKSLEIKHTDSSIDADIYNHLASCSIDLFLPETTLELIIKAEKFDKQNPKLLGNKARSFLKKGDIDNAEKIFNKKLLDNQEFFKSQSEYLRDKTDLILLLAFKYIKTGRKDIVLQALEYSDEILNGYKLLEESEDISFKGKKIFVCKNLSYFLPFIDDELLIKKIMDIIQGIIELNIKESGPLGIVQFNLGRYYYKNNQNDTALDYFEKAEKSLFDYKAELYLVLAYIYLITNDEKKKEASMNHYLSLKAESDDFNQIINDNEDKIISDEFYLQNIYLSGDIQSNADKLIIF